MKWSTDNGGEVSKEIGLRDWVKKLEKEYGREYGREIWWGNWENELGEWTEEGNWKSQSSKEIK